MYSRNTMENYKKSLLWMGYPGRVSEEEIQKPEIQKPQDIKITDNICPICGKRLKNKRGVKIHVRIVHKEVN